MVERIVRWEVWHDPLLNAVESYRQRHMHEDGDTKVWEDTEERLPFEGPFAMTRNGIIPFHEGNVPSANFNFWMGHTNFDIDDISLGRIAREPGVEAVDVYTRYRFRVAIGKVFAPEAVLKGIEISLRADERPGGLEQILSLLRKSDQCWALVVYKNAAPRAVFGRDPNAVITLCKPLAAQATHIIMSWNEQ